MMNLLKKRSKRAAKNSSGRETVNLDISRVIPGYGAEDGEEAHEAHEAPAKPELAATPAPAPDADAQSAETVPTTLAEKSENWLRRDISQLTTSWASVHEDMADMARLKELRLSAHNLKGMAGSYGYPAISRLAGSLDTLLKSQAWQSNTKLIELHLAACQAAAHGGPSTDGEIDDVSIAVCDALAAQVEQLVTVNSKLTS